MDNIHTKPQSWYNFQCCQVYSQSSCCSSNH